MTKKIKIAHITTVDMFLRFQLFQQLNFIRTLGYEVVLISSSGPNVQFLERQGFRHIAVEMTRRFTPIKDIKSLFRLYRVLRREQFTLVHTHNPKPGLIGQIAARLSGVPIVVNTVHGFYFHENMPTLWRIFYTFIEKITARLSDLIFFVNPEDLDTAAQKSIGNATKNRITGPGGRGIDMKKFNPAQISERVVSQKRIEFSLNGNNDIIGFVGRMVAEKGIIDLIKAAKEVIYQRPDVKFLIVGPNDNEKKDALTSNIAKKYGIEKSIIFTGVQTHLPELLSIMDVFVLPTYREGFPLALMEAAAMGVPLVVTNVRGCRQVVENNINGLVVPINNAPALAKAILLLLSDGGLAQRLAQTARKKALTNYDNQLYFRKIDQEYKRLLLVAGHK